MKLKSFFKRLILIEEVIGRFPSPINGEISIYEDFFGRRSMRIGGVSQSGGLVVNIWACALREILNTKYKIQNTLILGLGAGGSAKLVAEKWPGIEIIGVEIDQMVVEIGKKYFGMEEIKNLKIVIGNAFDFNSPSKYDLILIDLCIGKSISKEMESKKFLNGLKKILSKDGIIVINRFYWGRFRQPAKDFEQKLKRHFSKVWSKKTVSNLLIFCKYDTISSVNKENHR